MEETISHLLGKFESGKLSRLGLITSLAAATATTAEIAAATAAEPPKKSADASIQRFQSVPGLEPTYAKGPEEHSTHGPAIYSYLVPGCS